MKGTSEHHSLARPVSYEIAFIAGFTPFEDCVEADVTSPLLDMVIHPSGSIRVRIRTRPAGSKGQGFVLDSFHVESLVEYLQGQAYVRRTLEAELVKNRAAWDKENRLGRSDIWKHVKVLHLAIDPLTVPDPEGLATLQKLIPDLPVERIVAKSDKVDTRSCFTVVLEVAWDDEHWRMAEFRDGVFVSMAAE